MRISAVNLLLLASAGASLLLAVLVLSRSPQKRTHRAFALLALNLAAWTGAVFAVANSHTTPGARTWLEVSMIFAAFLPATIYHFIAVFPFQRFDGNRALAGIFYACGILVAFAASTPWYVNTIKIIPGSFPYLVYGPALNVFGICLGLSMIASFWNLAYKLRDTTGVQRRQLEHVFFGIFLVTTLAALTNVLGPVLGIGRLEVYGPCFVLLMAGFFAYAMVRYHLLELWELIARTTLYGVLTSFVVLAFVLSISVVQWIFAGDANADLIATAVAALTVAAGLHPLKERVQLELDRWVMRRHYDSAALIEDLSRLATSEIRLEGLLQAVTATITERMGVQLVRVLIVEDGVNDELTIATSSRAEEVGRTTYGTEFLHNYLTEHPQPLLMEEVLQLRPGPDRMRLATHLAELDAWLCAPLMSNGRLVGVLTLGQKDTRDIYTSEDVHVFASTGPILAAALENARLYRSLEGANLHLERLLDNMRAGVVAVNPEGIVTTINRGACQLLGALRVGQPLQELPESVRAMIERTLVESLGVSEFEVTITGADGEPVPVLLSTASLANDAGEPRGAMILLHDLTEIKRLESNVHRADRLSSLGTLAAGMAHEIKNPLVSIKTFGQLFLERHTDPEYRETFAAIVPKEVDRIDNIVSRLLDFARPKPVKFGPQDVQEIMRQTVALVENQTVKSGFRVHAEYLDHIKLIYGDDQQLHQVFLNLLLNSIDALQGRTGGEIHIKFSHERQHLLQRNGTPMADVECCKVHVSDTGCGIPAGQVDQIFTPFFTTKATGSGLGLAVVHGIVTEHGGSVEVSSVEGVGTVVTVALPVCEQAALQGRAT